MEKLIALFLLILLGGTFIYLLAAKVFPSVLSKK
jgi:hypothetical protein